MATVTLVDYKVLLDGVFELDSENQDHFWEFTMPNNLYWIASTICAV